MSLFPQNIVDKNLQDSVVKHPKMAEATLRLGVSHRGPLLPAWGTRERERKLRDYWRHDYNTLFRGAVAALIKRVQSTPYTVKAPSQDGNRWQNMLMNADFGDWDRFLSKLLIDYSRHDQGGWVELIAPGDPRKAPTGPVSGLAVLDSLRCYPTGDPEYPVIYYDVKHAMHIMHRARVVQFIDSPDSDENTPGYGDCALSRAIAPVHRQILMGRYIQQSLDDEPPPGVAIFSNLGDEQVDIAIEKMHQARSMDTPGEWGRILRLYGLRKENQASVEFVTFPKPPESFDFEKYTNLDAREIAIALGIDVQDIWGELTGSGLGQGQQSEILAQKSRGKGFGRILKGLERPINQALPLDVEFSWTYTDPQQDMEEAQKMQLTAGSIQILGGVLEPDEQRALLANTVPAIHDVLVDEKGKVRKLGDADPKAANEEIKTDVQAETPAALANVLNIGTQKATKDFSDTAFNFALDFTRVVTGAGDASPAVTRSILRDALWNSGMLAYEDGLRDGGIDPSGADAEELARRRRVVAEWNASQVGYIEKFVNEVLRTGMTEDQVRQRADLWISKSLRAIYYAGLQDANANLVYPWLLGPALKHCKTCLSNAGQRHTMKEWMNAGMYPGASSLECGGYECKCKFGNGEKGKSTGVLPGAKPSLADRLTNWVRGLLGR